MEVGEELGKETRMGMGMEVGEGDGEEVEEEGEDGGGDGSGHGSAIHAIMVKSKFYRATAQGSLLGKEPIKLSRACSRLPRCLHFCGANGLVACVARKARCKNEISTWRGNLDKGTLRLRTW